MAKFYGAVGFVVPMETAPDVYTETPVARYYINDNIDVNNQISIVADPFAFAHFFAMRYVEWMGAYWNVQSVEVQSPRLIISIGGVYNGEIASTTI